MKTQKVFLCETYTDKNITETALRILGEQTSKFEFEILS